MSLFETRLSRRSFAAITAGTVAIAPFAKMFANVEGYEEPANAAELSGDFEADGSSTLGPLTEVAIEDFAAVAPNVRITNGISGSGGGFSRFAKGEIVISNASREIKAEEAEACAANGIEWFKFDMALDGITVVVSSENDFIEDLTVDELASLWSEDGGVTNWSDVREGFPEEPVQLYGPGTASGTFDFFKEEILGKERNMRTDFTPSEDDNVLVQGVAGSPYALGFFGYSYYEENQDTLKAVAVDGVAPSIETIGSGEYSPLGRTLFIYVNAGELQSRPEVQEFVKYFGAMGGEIAPVADFIALPQEDQQATYDKVVAAIAGEIEPDSASFGKEEEAEATPAS